VVVRDLGLHLVGAIQCRGDLSKDLAGSVQFPRDLVRGRTSGPFVAVEPGTRAGRAVVERPELVQRLLQRRCGCEQRSEDGVDLTRVVDGSSGVREAAQRLLCFGRIRGGIVEGGHLILLLIDMDGSISRCARCAGRVVRFERYSPLPKTCVK
jgi:hypothetical protein